MNNDNHNKDMWNEINAGRKLVKIYRAQCKPSDMERGLPHPPIEKPAISSSKIQLITDFSGLLLHDSYLKLIATRRSLRDFSNKPLTLGQLSFLLWSTQGVQKIIGDNRATLHPVAGGGNGTN